MRVTDQMLVDSTLQNLWANEARIQTYENELTTGKKLSQISDNPQDGARALTIRSSIAQNDQYLRNVDAGKAWLNATDDALNGVDQALLRAQELAVQGANDTLSAADRQGMAEEVDSLLGEMVQFGNATYAGSYLFNGAQTTTAPFSYASGVVSYMNADPTAATRALQREIGPGTQIQVNTIGHDPTTNQALFDVVFTALSNFKQSLLNSDTSAIQASIQELQGAHQRLLDARESVGARINQVAALGTQLTNLQTRLAQTQAGLEDADIVKAAMDYSQADVVRKAGLAASKSLPPSLFDYLT